MTQTLCKIKADAEAFHGVYAANIWFNRRVYINFVDFDGNFAGCRNLKVYYDIKTGWQVQGGGQGDFSRRVHPQRSSLPDSRRSV